MVDQLTASLLGVPILHKVLNFFELPQIKLLLVCKTALFELIPPRRVEDLQVGLW